MPVDLEAELQDDRFMRYMLGVWEREMEAFRMSRVREAVAPPESGRSAMDLMRGSDAHRYLRMSQRSRRRRPTR